MFGIQNGSETSNGRLLRKSLALLALLLAAPLFLAACGGSDSEGHGGGHGGEELLVEGEPFDLGPFEYNVLFSRPLNRYDVEDRDYLVGQPPPEPGELYVGVFVRIINNDEEKGHKIPDSFEILDTTGERFENLESRSIFRLKTGTVLGPGDQAPAIDSAPQTGPVQAALLVYLMDQETLELRPIEMEIPGEEEGEVVRVELDL